MNYSTHSANTIEESFEVGEVMFQPSSNTIFRNGSSQRIEPRLMTLLLRLYQAAGEVVSRDELISDVWGGQPGSDEALTQAVSRLRREMGDVPGQANMIETIPKRGYRLRQPNSAAPAVADDRTVPSIRSPLSQNQLLWLAVLLLLGLYLHSMSSPPMEKHEIEIILDEPPTSP
ncbi:MAG: winged helix-turn-helix domain-containing protein [Pseudomonadota bacterium]